MSDERQKQLLATYVRNHMSGPGAIFSPFDGLDLTYNREGTLCKVAPGTTYGEPQQQLPLIHQSELFAANEDEIWGAVIEGLPIVHEVVESEPAIDVVTTEKMSTPTRKRK